MGVPGLTLPPHSSHPYSPTPIHTHIYIYTHMYTQAGGLRQRRCASHEPRCVRHPVGVVGVSNVVVIGVLPVWCVACLVCLSAQDWDGAGVAGACPAVRQLHLHTAPPARTQTHIQPRIQPPTRPTNQTRKLTGYINRDTLYDDMVTTGWSWFPYITPTHK